MNDFAHLPPPPISERVGFEPRRYHEARRAAERCGDIGINVRSVFGVFGGYCWICEQRIKERDIHTASVDHVVPLSRGGTHTWDNVRLAHRTCNMQRGSALPEKEDIVAKYR